MFRIFQAQRNFKFLNVACLRLDLKLLNQWFQWNSVLLNSNCKIISEAIESHTPPNNSITKI